MRIKAIFVQQIDAGNLCGIPFASCVVRRSTSLSGRTTAEGMTERAAQGIGIASTESACEDTPNNRARLALANIPYSLGTLIVAPEEQEKIAP